MIELRMLSRLVLRETRLRQFLDLSSSSGNACALNLGRNQQSRTPICKLIPQGERCNLSKNSFFHCIREISICSNLVFARLPTFGYLIKWLNCNKYSHLEWRHRYSSLSLCNNDLVH